MASHSISMKAYRRVFAAFGLLAQAIEILEKTEAQAAAEDDLDTEETVGLVREAFDEALTDAAAVIDEARKTN